MANTYLTRTFSSNGNRKTFTISVWIKSTATSAARSIFHGDTGSNTNGEHDDFYFTSNDTIAFGGWNSNYIYTLPKYRDTNAWYHAVLSVDTTQATAANRVKFYINNVEQSRTQGAGYPAQNFDTAFIKAGTFEIAGNSAASGYGNYVLSHYHFVDGTALTPSTFGSTDSTTGEWKINTSPTVSSYGTNGFFILKDGNSGTDQSPNSNNFTVGGGTLTKTEDCPSNVFNNFNNLIPVPSSSYSNGNTKAVDGAGAHKAFYGSLGFSSGKYYWEAKAVGGSKYTIGLSDVENYINYTQVTSTNVIIGESSNSYGSGDAIGWYYNDINKNGSNIASGIHTIVTNDIMMVAVDADAGKIYYGLNGTWRVANSTTFNASSNDTTFTTGKTYTPAFSAESCGWEVNFGNGYFGTTAVSSAGTNASGNGIFEYDVPTGYTALSTKGLNL